MKKTKGFKNKVVCEGCGCSLEKENSLQAKKYGSPDYVYICSKCVHSGHEGFVYCNECYGLDDACWVNSDLLHHTVCTNDEGQNMICPKIIELFEDNLYKCSGCGRWYRKETTSILESLGIDTDLCYECYREKFLLDLENQPGRADNLIKSAFTCYGEICVHLLEKNSVFYIKATSLYGYKELLCDVSVSDDLSKMRIDFVSSDMSDARRYFVQWLLERNRESIFNVFRGKYAPGGSAEKYAYTRYVKILGANEKI